MNERLKPDGIAELIQQSAETIKSLADQVDRIHVVCGACVSALESGGQILTAGNGGSAAEALHMAEELVGRYRSDRCSLPAISLVADSTALTCISNDFGYDRVFSRQVESLGREGDVLVLFSTSGKGAALLNAARAAKEKGLTVIGFLGKGGGELAGLCDYSVIVESDKTERIQEAHQVLLHIVLEDVEQRFV